MCNSISEIPQVVGVAAIHCGPDVAGDDVDTFSDAACFTAQLEPRMDQLASITLARSQLASVSSPRVAKIRRSMPGVTVGDTPARALRVGQLASFCGGDNAQPRQPARNRPLGAAE